MNMSFNHFAAPLAALSIAAASAQAQNLSIQGNVLYESPIGGTFIPDSGPGPADLEPGDVYNLDINFQDLGSVLDFGSVNSSSNIFLYGDYGLNVGDLDIHGNLITQTFVHDNVWG